jgi:hypothetical protein
MMSSNSEAAESSIVALERQGLCADAWAIGYFHNLAKGADGKDVRRFLEPFPINDWRRELALAAIELWEGAIPKRDDSITRDRVAWRQNLAVTAFFDWLNRDPQLPRCRPVWVAADECWQIQYEDAPPTP